MKILTLILLSILVIPTLASSRTWTSDIGTKIEAEFTSFQNGTVELRASDGRKIELAIGRLSIKDQQYIKDFTGSNFKPKINSNSVNSNLDAYPTELKIGSFMNGIGGIIFILSYIVLLIKAFSEGFLWGIGSFIIPFFVLFSSIATGRKQRSHSWFAPLLLS